MLELAWSDFFWFVDQALDAITTILGDLGDDLANRRPALEGANSPYQVVAHCLGVMEFWGGAVALGRPSQRDREAEFVAQGPLAELLGRLQAARTQLQVDVAASRPLDPPALSRPGEEDAPFWRSQGAAFFHIYEELAQHLGQLELTRDALFSEAGRRPT